jgi:hypothetical protein
MGAIPPNLSLKLGDIYAGVEETGMDRLLPDLPELAGRWTAKSAVRPGGILFAHSPEREPGSALLDASGRWRVRDAGGVRAPAAGLDGSGTQHAASHRWSPTRDFSVSPGAWRRMSSSTRGRLPVTNRALATFHLAWAPRPAKSLALRQSTGRSCDPRSAPNTFAVGVHALAGTP